MKCRSSFLLMDRYLTYLGVGIGSGVRRQKAEIRQMADVMFPKAVEKTLKKSGWKPGRDKSALVNDWIQTIDEIGNKSEAIPYQRFPLAITVLQEFGGIKIKQGRRKNGVNQEGFQIDPLLHLRRPSSYARIGAEIGRRVYPLGSHGHELSALCIADNGWVLMIHPCRDIKVGHNIHEALTNLILGNDLKDLYED